MMMKKRAWMLAATASLAMSAAALAQAQVDAPSVQGGIQAWQAGNYDEAVRNWRLLADRGDADAQYNIAQAYFLGRGVPQNANLAEQWFERAARQGHQDAQANYGLLLFQNGRRREAMQWIEPAANRGDPRAQYVLGTALFNGDLITQDLPRAWAMMSRAAGTGLGPAVSQLAQMESHIPAEDRSRGEEIARGLPTLAPPVQVATATAPPSRVTTEPIPPSRPAPPPPAQAQPPAPARAQPQAQSAPRPATPAPAAGGRWRIQLGAYSSEANARRAWSAVSGRLSGLQPHYVRAGNIVRLQAGPLANRAAAERACAAAGQACFPVAP